MARLAYRPDSGASMYVPELDEALDAWACGTLWNAVWDPAADCLLEAFRLLVEDGDGRRARGGASVAGRITLSKRKQPEGGLNHGPTPVCQGFTRL